MPVITGVAILSALYNVVEPTMWISLLLALVAGLLRVRPMLAVLGVVVLFGTRVVQTYEPAVGQTLWPYVMALTASALAIAVYLIGLGVSNLSRRLWAGTNPTP